MIFSKVNQDNLTTENYNRKSTQYIELSHEESKLNSLHQRPLHHILVKITLLFDYNTTTTNYISN